MPLNLQIPHTIHQLSGSTSGQPIQVTATVTPGDTIHTVPADRNDIISLEATNRHTANVTLVIEWGTTGTAASMEYTLTKQTTTPIVVGRSLSDGGVVTAFCATTAVVNITGEVARLGGET
jgi:hypothetical protein